jgi:shikimate kinase
VIDLVLISGPIASGKTTLAQRLAEKARERDIVAAAIDMDEIVEMVAGSDWSQIQLEQRQSASKLAAQVSDAMMAMGIQFVVMAGSTVSPYEWDIVVLNARRAKKPFAVLLRVSLAEAQRRAAADENRGSTRDPDVVSSHFAAYDLSRENKPDLDLMTDGLDSDDVLMLVTDAVFELS